MSLQITGSAVGARQKLTIWHVFENLLQTDGKGEPQHLEFALLDSTAAAFPDWPAMR